MILQALANYYCQLLESKPGEIARPLWCSRRVRYMLDISTDGTIKGVIPYPDKKGVERYVPEQVKKSSGYAANFLCDNSTFLLGADAKGTPERAIRCFAASRELHEKVLAGIDSKAAQAVLRFFEKWEPGSACEALTRVSSEEIAEGVLAGGNLEFTVRGIPVLDDAAIGRAWESYRRSLCDESSVATCLVSGERAPIARLHPSVRGVAGAQASGASLVGFNVAVFESYGHDGEQGLNAPVSQQAAFAYTTALNYLLSDPNHHMVLGETSVVYWAAADDENCAQVFSTLFGRPAVQSSAKGKEDGTEDDLSALMDKIEAGEVIDGVEFDTPFYVLGLAPNTSRLSVRFFYRSSFGDILQNLAAHYRRLDVGATTRDGRRLYLTPWMLLKEIENPHTNKSAAPSKKSTLSPLLGGALLRAILADSDYPESLFAAAMLRTRATQDDPDKHIYKVTRGRVAIVKAYLLKNKKRSEEEVTVSLNENRTDAPYVLGRMFSELENIQRTSAGDINSTIKDRYFNSACATPGAVFPTLRMLSQNHLKKIRRERGAGLAIALEKRVQELADKLDTYPKHLTLEEQGDFLMGYDHQTTARFKRNATTTEQED